MIITTMLFRNMCTVLGVLAVLNGIYASLNCGTFFQDLSCRQDCGSCGTACCSLRYTVDMPAADLWLKLNSLLQTSVALGNGITFVTKDDGEGYPLMLQLQHNSFDAVTGMLLPDGRDDIYISVTASSNATSVVAAFSKSYSYFSVCDGGRNYFNLNNLMSNLNVQRYTEATLYGCAVSISL